MLENHFWIRDFDDFPTLQHIVDARSSSVALHIFSQVRRGYVFIPCCFTGFLAPRDTLVVNLCEFKGSRVLSSLLPHTFLHESVMKTSWNHHDSMSFNLILCVPWIFGASSKVTLSAFCVVMSQRFSSILNLGVVEFFSMFQWTNTTRSFQNSFQITRRNPSNTEWPKQRQRSRIDLHLCQDLAIS